MLRPGPRLVAFLLLLAAQARLWGEPRSETGRFLLNAYSAKTYAASPVNFAITQDLQGVMYFGNSDGVVVYDGTTWRRIPVPNGDVLSIARDAKGNIYVGGNGLIGWLRPDATGDMRFVSLSGLVPPADQQFGVVFGILASPEGVYFSSSRRLFLLQNDGKIRVWSGNGNFRRLLFRAFDHVYVANDANGLIRIEGQRLVPVEVGRSLASDPPVAAFGWNGITLIASRKKLYRLQRTSFEPFPTGADSYLAEHQISSLDHLPNGDLMIGTRGGGLVLLNQDLQTYRVIDKSAGLPGDSITAVNLNNQGVVWLATRSGLASFVPSLNSFSASQGIGGSIYSIGRNAGTLVAGSTAGLFRLQYTGATEPTFQGIDFFKSGTTVWTFESSGDSTLFGADSGAYSLSGQEAIQILNALYVYDLHFSKLDPQIVHAAGRDGVFVLRREGATWKLITQERVDGQDFKTVAEDVDGRVWATTRLHAWRFDFHQTPTKVERFDGKQGLPDGWKNVYRFRDHIVFATDKGLMQFSESKRRFFPDPELGVQFSDGSKPVFLLQEDPRHNVWISGKGYHGYLHRNSLGKQEWIPMPLLASGIEDIWALHVDDDGVVWASGSEGSLFRWDPRRADIFDQNFQVLIRRISVAESNKTLFGGSGFLKEELRVPWQENALRFEFAAPFFEDPSSVQYQFRLDGTERDWSPWTKESHKDFTNLPPHHFLFHVRARSPHGAITPEAVFLFRVLPPWYRTWWAYVLYAVGMTALSRVIFSWRLQVLQAKNLRLEEIVQERTVEVRSQRDQNEALLLNILPAPVALELRDSGSVTPMTYDDVTVCFTDFVGFTLSSENLPASELVTALNEYFTAFDGIMSRYGLEKLKTIGDSYMFVSGLPERRPSHAVDAVLAAMEMVYAAQALARAGQNTTWRMRVGLYSGPVVAGVVGKSKFAFDIWGSTVNLASRMESSAAPDRVNLSMSTWEHVHALIECEARGRVLTKDGRELEMFFALGPRPDLLDGSVKDGVPGAFRSVYQGAFSYPPRAFPEFFLQPEPQA